MKYERQIWIQEDDLLLLLIGLRFCRIEWQLNKHIKELDDEIDRLTE
jgi:hypothetical protein